VTCGVVVGAAVDSITPKINSKLSFIFKLGSIWRTKNERKKNRKMHERIELIYSGRVGGSALDSDGTESLDKD